MTTRTIHVADSKGLNARVQLLSPSTHGPERRLTGPRGQPVKSIRILKGSVRTSYPALLRQHGTPEALAQALVDSDPEIDLELAGSALRGTKRIVLKRDLTPAYSFEAYELIRAPSGEVKDRRPHVELEANINAETPVKWTGKYVPRKEAARKYAIIRTLEIAHVDGLSYSFLYSMAKDLEEKDSLMLVSAGNGPIVMSKGHPQYRGFLEGRTQGEKYCLLLHLTAMELKPVEVQ